MPSGGADGAASGAAGAPGAAGSSGQGGQAAGGGQGGSAAGGGQGAPIGAAERERRAALLYDIARRIAADGEHTARPGPGRARQFMPFAALKGYEGLVQDRARAQETLFNDREPPPCAP